MLAFVMLTAYPATRISRLRAADRRSGPRALCLAQPELGGPRDPWAASALHRAGLGEHPATPAPTRPRAPAPTRPRVASFGALAMAASVRPELSSQPEHLRSWLAARRLGPGGLGFRLAALALEDPALRVDDRLQIPVSEQRWLMQLSACGDRLTHFQRLGLAPTADSALIRRGYLRVAQRLHPDRYYGRHIGRFAAVLVDLFHRAHVAQAYLADPQRRGRYLGQLAAVGHRVSPHTPL